MPPLPYLIVEIQELNCVYTSFYSYYTYTNIHEWVSHLWNWFFLRRNFIFSSSINSAYKLNIMHWWILWCVARCRRSTQMYIHTYTDVIEFCVCVCVVYTIFLSTLRVRTRQQLNIFANNVQIKAGGDDDNATATLTLRAHSIK